MVIYSKYLNEIKLQSVCVFLAFSFLFFFYFICFIFLGLRGLTPSLHSLPELFSESSITILKTSNLSATSFSISSTFKKSLFSLSKSVSSPGVDWWHMSYFSSNRWKTADVGKNITWKVIKRILFENSNIIAFQWEVIHPNWTRLSKIRASLRLPYSIPRQPE